MRASFSPGYSIPLPQGHRFPMPKFRLLFELLVKEGLLDRQDVFEPTEAAWDELGLVHTDVYLRDLRDGTLDRKAERRMGLPWSPALVRRSRLAVAGTIAAGAMALEDGIAANLAGGTHHAFPGHGEGFCVLNDIAVAIRVLRRGGKLRHALVVDLDVHQGNGTAAIFAEDPETYTFSMHGERNFPFVKERSDRDVALPDGIGDAEYLRALACHLPEVLDAAGPDLVFYLAGVDPVDGDRFGRLGLTRAGLALRERSVLDTLRRRGTPVAVLMSGGYAETPGQTADLHAEVHRQARAVF